MSTPTPPPTPPPNPPPPPPSPPPAAPAAPPALVGSSASSQIRIVSHSNLFYWWPVWAVGFLMALLTFVDGHRLAVVTWDAKARRDIQVVTGSGGPGGMPTTETYEGIVLTKGGKLWPSKLNEASKIEDPDQPHLYMAARPTYGVVFCATLLLVIFITNVPLRGLWSVVVIVFVVMLVVIFALAGWWDDIIHALGLLDVRINLAGYVVISLVLLAIWLFTTLFFDRQIYMIFTPGQGKVCTEIGGGETAFDSMGMTIEKQRDDLFRHWILGLGSGDMTVRTSGANPQTFNLHNVLFVGRKLQMIEDMQRDRPVVRG